MPGARSGLERVRRMLDPLRRRVLLMLARGEVTRAYDAPRMQELQVSLLAGEVRTLEHFQPLGLSVVPEPGAEVLAAFLGGNRDHGWIVQVDDRRYRPTGKAEAELTLYEPRAGGSVVRFLANGDVEISPRSGILRVSGDVVATGDVEDADGTMDEMRTTYNTHTHPGDSGGTTGVPNQPMV